MNDEALKLALEAAYLAGFNASGEGYNGEYPFQQKIHSPEENAVWCKDRDNEITAIKQALAAPVQVSPVFGPPIGVLMKMEGDETRKLYPLKPAPVQEPVAWMDRDGDLYANEPDKNWCPPHYPLYTTPPAAQRQRVVFPTMLRKMWSGGEVQAWLDETVNKENT
jgi:hypothetical protein